MIALNLLYDFFLIQVSIPSVLSRSSVSDRKDF